MSKIKIFQQSFANIDDDFLKLFHEITDEISIIIFIKKSVFKDYGFYLESIEDIEKLDECVNHDFYKNKSEWLKEKMRNEMKAKRKGVD